MRGVRGLRGLCALALALAGAAAHAAAEEIQVYLDDLSEPGQFGLDVHNNLVFAGARTPSYDGELPPRHVYRLTPEFYYGISKTLELGLYVLSTRSPEGSFRIDGSKARLKYIAPHDEQRGFFWGLNLEAGRSRLAVSETPWNAELKGILGWRGNGWTLGANPNLDWSLSKGGGPVAASLDLKLARSVSAQTQLGLELYSELGPLKRIEAWSRNPKTLYLVLDQSLPREFDLNLGLGRGLTGEGDRWLLKFIVGTHF
jgi:hypothetical protein